MKKLYFLSLIIYLFSGCGGTSSPSSDDDKNTHINIPTGFSGYILSDYLFADSSNEVDAYKYKNSKFFQTDRLSYSYGEGGVIKLRSLTNLGGYVDFRVGSDGSKIDVNIYKDGKQNKFSLKNYVDLNDTLTNGSDECKVVEHFDNFSFDDKSFDDVIEIDCPKSKGYYQKGQGFVLEDRVS